MNPVTVGELIAKLEEMPFDMQVVMSIDSEGNGYSPQIEVEKDFNNCIILYPGYTDEIDEVVENYVYEDED